MREVVKLSVRLLLFALIAGLLLALTNEVTKGPIAQRQQETLNQARAQVLPEAQEFVEMDIRNPEQYPDITAIYEGKNGDETVGYAFTLAPQGYKAAIEMTLGINSAGAITELMVNSQEETAGLGTQVTEEPFLSQFWGMAAGSEAVSSGVDTITGATISSTAVKNAVAQAAGYAETELFIVPTEDPALKIRVEPDEEDLRRMAMVEDAKAIQALDPYALMGYDAVQSVYAVETGSGTAYVIEVQVTSKDVIRMSVAIDPTGTISQVSVLEQHEGEGYGSKIAEEPFLSQFAGQKADGALSERVDAITGATSSSSVAIEGIAQAARFYEEQLSGLPQGGN
ncbi:MAG TPA: FMN-binding protein [Candidatus Faecaligallichristensenella faecipullorum]|nr:FMN-binding protein [Candidatus Faecaligallichristensenella faecipullorum]